MTRTDLGRLALTEPRPLLRAELLRTASRDALTHACARGDLVRVLPGAYSSPVHAESWTVRSQAAALWAPASSAITGRGALFELGLIPAPPDVVDVVVPRDRHRPSAPWIRVTSQTLPTRTRATAAGVALAECEFALIHAHRREPARTRAELVYAVCARGDLRADRVLEVLEQLPKIYGRAALMRRLELAQRGVESYLEEQGAEQVLTGPEFSRLLRQHRVRVAGQSFRIDAFDAATLTAFEFDGAQHHTGVHAREADAARDALLATLGILTVRFPYRRVMDRPQWCREVALGTLEARGMQARVA